jgi:hypothetical protein
VTCREQAPSAGQGRLGRAGGTLRTSTVIRRGAARGDAELPGGRRIKSAIERSLPDDMVNGRDKFPSQPTGFRKRGRERGIVRHEKRTGKLKEAG